MEGPAKGLASSAARFLHRASDYLESHSADELVDTAGRTLRQRPVVAIGIALGLGFVFARALKS